MLEAREPPPLLFPSLICQSASQEPSLTRICPPASQPNRPEIKGTSLSEHFSGVHDKASADAEALSRLGSHPALPRGWQ